MTCLLAAIFTILAIELNLSWNSITDVYSVDSVGQLIPLAMGTVGLIPVLYKLYKKSFLVSIAVQLESFMLINREDDKRASRTRY